MGGTSTDVSRYAGTFEHVFETTTAGVTIQAPQLDVNTVAAGAFAFGAYTPLHTPVHAKERPLCFKQKNIETNNNINGLTKNHN
jgi:5-oxoprolinase (ATP-hydrolysing)